MSKKKETVKPLGFTVLVRLDEVTEKSEGGIILTTSDKTKREYAAQTRGTIVAIGPEAWDYEGGEGSKCEVGDRVLFARYAGVKVEEDDYSDRVMNDKDIIGKLESVDG